MRTGVDLGKQLYQLLPALYRARDNAQRDAAGAAEPGDLAKLLAAHGDILTAFHGTLTQLLYDAFPDEAGSDASGRARSCQPWLIPYFAQLLDVALVSPDTPGQRAEVAHAVAWRQRKGTRVAVEDIAEKVGGFEVEIQEGWKRVAKTPVAGEVLPSALSLGEAAEIDMALLPPSRRAEHPGIRAATVDFRQRSRAVRVPEEEASTNPAARVTTFAGTAVPWRQVHPHGVPCFPGTYQDVSQRTPDLRTPRYDRGHFHPRRVLLFTPPPGGYFSEAPATVGWADVDLFGGTKGGPIRVSEDTVEWNGAPVKRYVITAPSPRPLKITGNVELTTAAVFRFEDLWIDGRIEVKNGKVELSGCAARAVVVETPVLSAPVIEARGTLFQSLTADRGLVQLEYCTVLRGVVAEALHASDCIFARAIRKDPVTGSNPGTGCIRYSRVAQEDLGDLLSCTGTLTREEPWFISSAFGEPGCGVLHLGAAPALRHGAEDGGELGAYHDRRLCLLQDAVLTKLADYLPVGTEAVLTFDSTLLCPPPGDSAGAPPTEVSPSTENTP